MTYTYKPYGVCSRMIHLEIDDNGILTDIRFEGGCDGNLQGVGTLAAGRDAKEVQGMLSGIRCENKPTSCPDQLARAIGAALEQQELSQKKIV